VPRSYGYSATRVAKQPMYVPSSLQIEQVLQSVSVDEASIKMRQAEVLRDSLKADLVRRENHAYGQGLLRPVKAERKYGAYNQRMVVPVLANANRNNGRSQMLKRLEKSPYG
jgi:hypothetical protein